MNKKNLLLSTVIENTYSKEDIFRRLSILRKFFEHKFYKSGNISLDSFLSMNNISQPDKQAMMQWKNNLVEFITRENFYNYLNKTYSDIYNIPIVLVYIPYDINNKDIDVLGRWFRDNLHPFVIMEIRKDKNLIGGCAFAWQGVIYNYSLHFFLQKKRDDILNLISNYVHQNKHHN